MFFFLFIYDKLFYPKTSTLEFPTQSLKNLTRVRPFAYNLKCIFVEQHYFKKFNVFFTVRSTLGCLGETLQKELPKLRENSISRFMKKTLKEEKEKWLDTQDQVTNKHVVLDFQL